MRVFGNGLWVHRTMGLPAVAVIATTIAGGLSILKGQDHVPASTVIDGSEAQPADLIQFNRQIRPILSENCFRCHGNDPGARQADLRLDLRDRAIAELETGGAAITPGNSSTSKLIARITSDDDDFRMPPPESGKTLSADEIELFGQWIDQGAPWQPHWSFITPHRPDEPRTNDPGWARNGIDTFVADRLVSEGLAPSPEANRATLIRRVTFDLTGLPPTIDEIDAFLSDDSLKAYENVVDRLLESPRYGEHMARYWLDAARYGDTHGLHLDNNRSMWPWRDWVINAYNANMPFDQFTIEQLAGDLLPDATIDQRIATGFNRNNVTTSEGGAIDAEYLVKYAADRVETTSTVWMGLTTGCAQCHDHKFDPISQKEYYQLFAYFNNITEKAMDGNRRDPPPIVRAPSSEASAKLELMRAQISSHETELDAPMPEVDAAQAQWQRKWRQQWNERWIVLDPTAFVSTGGSTLTKLDDHSLLAEGENPAKDTYQITARFDGTDLRIVRLEALTDDKLPSTGPGRAPNANFVLSEIEAEIVSIADSERREPIEFVGAAADHEQMNGPFLVSAAIDGIIDNTNGWAVEGFKRRENRTALFLSRDPFGYEGGTELRIRLRFETHFTQHGIGRVRLAVSSDKDLAPALAPSEFGPWHMIGPFRANDGKEAYKLPFGPEQQLDAIDLTSTYQDGKLTWTEQSEFVDETVHMLKGDSCATYLYRTVDAATARRMELSLGSDDAIKVWLNGRVVHDNFVARRVAPNQDRITIDLDAGPNHLLMKIVNITGGYGFYFRKASEDSGGEFLKIVDLLATEETDLDPQEQDVLRRYYRRNHSPQLKEVYDALQTLRGDAEELLKTLPITLVMQERDDRRQTYVLNRGEYDQPRDKVSPGVPAVLAASIERSPTDRLGLARWLVDQDHPLTARVTVNRLWQQLFGVGLVKTAEDFGSQGEWPSHPKLLDWLACELIDNGWDIKHMLRLMVTSATYRQSSHLTPQLHRIDPENRLLGRGPRFRLDAESIRDSALAISGLLVEELGGPSVRPYQPEGLWKAVAYPDSDTQVFKKDEGEAQYRRSLYTYWKRTSPPPNMTAFDAPSRETCTVRRPRTNTPLQALILLNDPQFVEAARALAQRAMLDVEASPEARIVRVFRLVTARPPTEIERNIMLDLYYSQLRDFEDNRDAATQLLSVGDSPRDETLDVAEHAAMLNVAATILSLDEAVTKG